MVVNFDVPVDMNGQPDFETYLNRIERAGRFGKSGDAINMVDSQRSMEVLKQIEAHFRKFQSEIAYFYFVFPLIQKLLFHRPTDSQIGRRRNR